MSLAAFQERIQKGPIYTTDLGARVIPAICPRWGIYYRFVSIG